MDGTITTNAMSSSLLARDVYCVCFPQRDSLDLLHGEFAAARKKFFTGGKKAVKMGRNEIVKGFDGKLHGKLSRRGLYWKKTATGVSGAKSVALEEAFDQRGGHVLVTRDFRSVIVSRAFFDRGQIWLKSEYYEPWDTGNARVIFKPGDVSDTVERFDWDAEKKRYRSTMLYPAPYLFGTAEQSILNARFGEPQLLIAAGEGDFCYCPQSEAEARKRALKEIHDGAIVLMPAWEVKDGSLAGDTAEEEANVTFPSLEEYARIEPPRDAAGAEPSGREEESVHEEEPMEESGKELSSPGAPGARRPEEFTPPSGEEGRAQETAASNMPKALEGPDGAAILEAARRAVGKPPEAAPPAPEPGADKPAGEKTEDELILEAAKKAETAASGQPAPPPEESGETALSPGAGCRGSIRDGKITGRGRTEQPNGLTAYDGEYRDGRREGFGSHYYKDGNLCYAGFWENDKKDGLGVSFRGSDHALHIANWKNGEPGGFVSLFDRDGNLRYGGRIEDGKKQGAGVSFHGTDGTVFVGKWVDGQATGIGSSFGRDGSLLYYGGWKDGKRSGHGTEFDGNGGIVFDGEWKDGKYHNGILYQKLSQADADTSGPHGDR